MIKKIKTLSRGKKTGVIATAILALIMITPSTETNTNNQTTPPTESQQNALKVDVSEKQPIVVTETKLEYTTESVAFESVKKNDSSIEKGKTTKSVTGVLGEKTTTHEVIYTDGKETSRNTKTSLVTKQPVSEVILVGTKEPVKYVAPAPAPAPKSNCDPNYSPCVPNVSGDLDCPDIGFMVTVTGSDRHRFDRDGDGYGCESYN